MDQVLNRGDVDFDLTSWVDDKLSALSPVSLKYSKNCIYEVQEDKAKYVPRVVSIGFLHHGKSQLEDMQEHKVKYLHHFLHTFQVTIDQLVEYIRGQEALVCECYEDAIIRDLLERCKVKPSAVILLDGIFIVELFLRNYFPEMRDEGDILLDDSWASNCVLHDLMLLGNQLPLRFLRSLYDEFVSKQCSASGFDELVLLYFQGVMFNMVISPENLRLIPEFLYARHFVEFLSMMQIPNEKTPRARPESEKKRCPSAQTLKAAGVKFRPGEKVWFDAAEGELTIPRLYVNPFTATILRNLIAFEQSGCRSKHTTRYVMLLSELMEWRRDVNVLVRDGIINYEPGVSSTWEVLEILNDLDFKADLDNFQFVDLDYNHLRAYKRDLLHEFLSAVFSRFQFIVRYYGNPAGINFLLVVVGIYIAIIQTVLAMLPIMKK